MKTDFLVIGSGAAGLTFAPVEDAVLGVAPLAVDERTNEIETMLAKVTVVATGGCGNIYSTTSNPVVATGDGIAMQEVSPKA